MPDSPSRLQNSSNIIVAVVAAAAGLIYTKTVMIPFVLALLVSFIVSPGINLIEKKLKIPRVFAVVLMFLLIAVGFGLFSAVMTGTAKQAAANFEIYRLKITILSERIFGLLDSWGVEVGLDEMRKSLRELPFFTMAQSTLGKLTSMVSNAFLITIFVVFLLTGKPLNIPETSILNKVGSKIRVYLVTKSVTSSVTGVLTAIILLAVGLDMAVMFGVLAFLLNFIPTVGSMFAVLMPIPVAILQFDTSWKIAVVVALPAVVQVVIGNIIEPKIMGDSLDLHPVTIMLFLMFWGLIWGIPGMILATPFAVIVKISLDNSKATQPLGHLMSGRFSTN